MWTANVTDRRYVLYGGCRKGDGMCFPEAACREGGRNKRYTNRQANP